MANLKELLAQKAEIEKAIEAARRQDRADAIAKVRALMVELDVSLDDLKGRSKADARVSGKPGGKVAPKYRNAATGDTWSGRGLKPKWLTAALAAGRKLEEFAV